MRFVISEDYKNLLVHFSRELCASGRTGMDNDNDELELSFETVLSNPLTLEVLRQYMSREQHVYPLDFHLDVETYKKRTLSPMEKAQEARYIFHRYFVVKRVKIKKKRPIRKVPVAMVPVVNDQVIIETIQKQLQKPTLGMFNQAQDIVLKHLKDVVFVSFQKSLTYKQIIEELNASQITHEKEKAAKKLEIMSASLQERKELSVNKPHVSTNKIMVSARRSSIESLHYGLDPNLKICTLEDMVEDQELMSKLVQFSKREYSEENILFWTEVREYIKLPEHLIKQRAQDIYVTYVKSGAQFEVPIDGVTRNTIKGQLDKPTIVLFERAQNMVFEFIRGDSYKRFLNSDIYASTMYRRAAERLASKGCLCC